MVIAYEKNGNVYYDYGNRTSILVATHATFVSASGNFIAYEKNGRIYKAEVDNNGYISRSGILVR